MFATDLIRVRSLRNEIPPKIASEIQERGTAIQKQFKLISPDLLGINAWRYQRQVSPGIQEFMEALSFEHYVRHQTLITLEEASKSLASLIILTGDDYLLGIFDFGWRVDAVCNHNNGYEWSSSWINH